MKDHILGGERKPGPLVEQALHSLMSDDAKAGQEAISVIGIFGEGGEDEARQDYDREPKYEKDEDGEDADGEDDLNISVLPARVNSYWDNGIVFVPGNRLVQFPSMMVQNTALDIMRLATNGRLTPQRFWRAKNHLYYDLNDDMHELVEVNHQDPSVVPGMDYEQVLGLEELGDVDKIRDAIVHQGYFWIWMRPDRLVTANVFSEASKRLLT